MGYGDVASFGHVPAIRESGLELAAVYDPNPARLAEFGERGTASASEFFEQKLDAVVIASPAGAHKANVLECARRKLPVLCEKPIAETDEDAEEMIAAMADTPFWIGFVYRFSPVATQIKRWIEDGVIGEPRLYRFVYDWDLHGQFAQSEGEWGESPRFRGRMLEGGPLVDCGVHQIDLARWWSGREVEGWQARGAWVLDGYDAPDTVFLHMDLEGGAKASVEVSFSYGHTAREARSLFTYDVFGTGGTVRYDRDGYLLEARTGDAVIRGEGASEKNFAGMYAALREALETGDPTLLPSARDGLIATRIATSATDSLRRHP